MKNFVIFFEEKEGTSPLVRLLDNFDQISIVHQPHNWEPFDSHGCGDMPLRSFQQCLDLIFDPGPLELEQLNRVYTRTSTGPLARFDKTGSVGFKMRFQHPAGALLRIRYLPIWNRLLRNLASNYRTQKFKNLMVQTLRRHEVVVFLAVRQDILRWALSKYHGDGTGNPGHLQFKLARGEIRQDDIAPIRVDCERLEEVISRCEKSHSKKWTLKEELEQSGIEVHPLCYEDFLEDKPEYLRRLCNLLGITISDEEIDSALDRGAYFTKVHSDDVSEFVDNHREVVARFGDRFISWR